MKIPGLFRRLAKAHGPQHWWPGETPFEVMVGAVLTQNTAWLNVEKALARLKAHDALDPGTIASMGQAALADLIRPSGCYRVKARRLQHLCRWLVASGDTGALAGRDTGSLRRELLDVHGIGPETADAILNYALQRPRFVADAYARRILGRVGLVPADASYDVLGAHIAPEAGGDTQLLGEWHALLVAHGKAVCRRRPLCTQCCLLAHCGFAKRGEPGTQADRN